MYITNDMGLDYSFLWLYINSDPLWFFRSTVITHISIYKYSFRYRDKITF